MRLQILIFAVIFAASSVVSAADGLITIKSDHSQAETLKRLEQSLKAKGMTVFARIDHTAGARKVDMALRPTVVMIFGNPKGGTPFMQCAQTVGIDLPLKALVWKDASGQVWFSYNDPAYLAARHKVPECPVIEKLSKVLEGVAREATKQ